MPLRFYGKTNLSGTLHLGPEVDSEFENVITLVDFENSVTDAIPGNTYTLQGSAVVSTAQTKFGSSSLFVPSGNNALTISNRDLGYFLQDAFTVEMWYYYTGAAQGDARLCQTRDGDFFSGLSFGHDSSGSSTALVASLNGTAQDLLLTGGTVPNLNEWNHVAVTRDASGLLTFWLNGQINLQGTIAGPLYWDVNHTTVVGGQTVSTARACNGYIDDFRITAGVARYQATFTPPTAALSVGDNTQSLLSFESGLTDSADVTNTWSITGSATVSTGLAKFGASSLFIPAVGSHSSIGILNSQLGNFLTGDFTVELWYYNLGSPGPSGRIFTTRDGGDDAGIMFGVNAGGGTNVPFLLWDPVSAAAAFVNGTTPLAVNEWTHMAVTRKGDTLVLWLNGKREIATTVSGALFWNDADTTRVGGHGTGTVRNSNGYIDDMRITNGESLYSRDFTPPAKAHVAAKYNPERNAEANDPFAADVVSLLGFDDGTLDDAKTSTTWSATGSPFVITDTNFTKFDGAALELNRTSNQYLQANQPLLSQTGDWTFECWCYLFSLDNAGRTPIVGQHTSANGNRVVMGVADNGFLGFFIGAVSTSYTASERFTLNKWTHVVWQRSGTNISLWQDGIQLIDATPGAVNIQQLNTTLGFFDFGPEYWDGYFDEVRFTQAARYTPGENFTPPTTKYPRS